MWSRVISMLLVVVLLIPWSSTPRVLAASSPAFGPQSSPDIFLPWLGRESKLEPLPAPSTPIPMPTPMPTATPPTPTPGELMPSPLAAGVATDFAAATAFLYSGDNPIQTGVAPGVIESYRVAVLRGRVSTRDGDPLSEVTITILGHPEFGQTVSRDDGMFDMTVNGGGAITVNYARAGYLPVQRQIQTPWRDYVWLPDVVMVPLDAQVTTIDLSASQEIQVAQGSSVTDADGTRQATLLFAQNTQAELVLPDGSTQAISTLNVRATEYTVGDSGPAAMPAALPPASGYTYAVEFSVDEAMAAGAVDVRFSQPVAFHVENFLDFPVGEAVPAGYYDRATGQWVASEDGRIIQILSVSNGLAVLDVDGSGQAASGQALADLGVTEAERRQLAELYAPGQSLWRVAIDHFTPWDCNWPYGPPDDAEPPDVEPPEPDIPENDPCEESASIIECQNQVLGERVGVVGAPFTLNYRSNRVRGRLAANSLYIPLSGDEVPASLVGIDLEVQIAGQRFRESFPPLPNQSYPFIWDGRDAYGREVQGLQPFTVEICFVYDLVYYASEADFERSFARTGAADRIIADRGRDQIGICQSAKGQLKYAMGGFDARHQHLGGWTLDVHHLYDPYALVLYLGNGAGISDVATVSGLSIQTTVGNGVRFLYDENVPATETRINAPGDIDIGPDGSLYVIENGSARVARVRPDGIIETFAGVTNLSAPDGDGGLATETRLLQPVAVAVGADGSVYIAENFPAYRVRRVTPDGIIRTVAGNGEQEISGDGGPATQAGIGSPFSIAVAPDGALYIADVNSHRIRQVGTDGIITTFAGSGPTGFGSGDFGGDGGPATQARLNAPEGIAVGPDGSLYIADTGNSRVRRVRPNGMIETVAGNGDATFAGDGRPAVEAALRSPADVVVADDGTLYIADVGNRRIRQVSPLGIIATIAGSGVAGGQDGFGDLGPAAAARVNGTLHLATLPDFSFYVADAASNRVRHVGNFEPGLQGDEVIIPAQDGADLYAFSPDGRHRRTLHALTGATLYAFTYDEQGRLVALTDGDGKVTTIERDAQGAPTAIIASFGQRTTLSLDANGYLTSITSPAGEAHTMTYDGEGGLLVTFSDPRGNVSNFSYDDAGRLVRDEMPDGGFWALARGEIDTDDSAGHFVTLTSAEGRVTRYEVNNLPTGDRSWRVVDPAGAATETFFGVDGGLTINSPDGAVMTLEQMPDPRWGMQAALPQSWRITTPGGRQASFSANRVIDFTDNGGILGAGVITDTFNYNGAVYTSVFDGEQNRIVNLSPLDRQAVTTLDEQGRPVAWQYANLTPIIYTYDDLGRLQQVEHGDSQQVYTFDSRGRISTIVDAEGRELQFAFDDADRLVQATLPSGRAYGYSYDASGNRTQVIMPNGAVHSLTHTPANLNRAYTPPGGSDSYLRTYNLDGQNTSITLPGGRAISTGYDAGGRPIQFEYPAATVTVAYPGATARIGELTRAPASGDAQSLAYTYDSYLITGMAWSGPTTGQYTYQYDNNFNLTRATLVGGADIVLARNEEGALTGYGPFAITRGGTYDAPTGYGDSTLAVEVTHDDQGRFTGRAYAVQGQPVYAVQVTHESGGRIVQKVETVGGVPHTYDYTYDLDGQLTQVERDGAVVERYAYDANGNRISRRLGANPEESASYDVQDRILQQGSVDYQVDADGFMVQRGGDTFTYSARGELLQATVGGQTITYAYDGYGRQAARTEGDDTYQFLYGNPEHDFQLTAVRNPDGVLTTLYYDEGGILFALQQGNTWYYVAADQLGSPRVITDSSGAVVKVLEYDSFGNVAADSDPTFYLPIGFAGGLAGPVTGLVRFGLRDYEPQSGRWTAKDPILYVGGQANLYVYVGNNPVTLRDPSGLFSVGGSIYKGVGGGGKIAITSKGWSVCAEVGIGLGTSLDLEPLGGLDATSFSMAAEVGIGVGDFGAKLVAENKRTPCGITSSIKSVFSGPGGLEAESGFAYGSEKGLEPGLDWKQKNDLLGKPPAPKGVKAQVKGSLQGCYQGSW